MRVLLISTNRERAPQPVIPLGLCLVASAVEAAGFAVKVLDLCFARHAERDIERAVREWRPDAIGLSVRNLDNGDYLRPRAYVAEVAQIARTCRACSGVPLIIGGAAVSIAPDYVLAATGANYAVVGEGEEAFPELLRRLAAGKTASGAGGVCCEEPNAQPGAARLTRAQIADLSAAPTAQVGRWLDLSRYMRWGSPTPVQSKRGCSFACVYCSYRLVEGARYRLRAPEAVVDEMRATRARWGTRSFEVVDSTFNHPPQQALELCEAISRAELGVELHTTGFNPAGTSSELLRIMRRAGFRSAVCTPDSGSDTMLERLRKGFFAEDVARTATWAREARLPVLWSFMFGGPGETERTVSETLDFIERALGSQDRIMATVGLRVYAGTELERIAREEGVIASDANLAEPVFYFSRQIAPARVMEMLEQSSRRSQMLYLTTLQEWVISWALREHAALRLRGPAWGAVPLYNRLARWSRPVTKRHGYLGK